MCKIRNVIRRVTNLINQFKQTRETKDWKNAPSFMRWVMYITFPFLVLIDLLIGDDDEHFKENTKVGAKVEDQTSA